MTSKSPEAMPRALTWKGHEFLDLASRPEALEQGQELQAPVGKTVEIIVLEENGVLPESDRPAATTPSSPWPGTTWWTRTPTNNWRGQHDADPARAPTS